MARHESSILRLVPILVVAAVTRGSLFATRGTDVRSGSAALTILLPCWATSPLLDWLFTRTVGLATPSARSATITTLVLLTAGTARFALLNLFQAITLNVSGGALTTSPSHGLFCFFHSLILATTGPCTK